MSMFRSDRHKLLVGRCKDIMSHNEDTLTLDVGGEALE